MIYKLFTVHDQKAEMYNPPVCKRTSGDALREFETLVNQEGHNFNLYPADYHIFELGEYDDLSAKIKLHEIPINLGCALEYVDKKKAQSSELQKRAAASQLREYDRV